MGEKTQERGQENCAANRSQRQRNKGAQPGEGDLGGGSCPLSGLHKVSSCYLYTANVWHFLHERVRAIVLFGCRLIGLASCRISKRCRLYIHICAVSLWEMSNFHQCYKTKNPV